MMIVIRTGICSVLTNRCFNSFLNDSFNNVRRHTILRTYRQPKSSTMFWRRLRMHPTLVGCISTTYKLPCSARRCSQFSQIFLFPLYRTIRCVVWTFQEPKNDREGNERTIPHFYFFFSPSSWLLLPWLRVRAVVRVRFLFAKHQILRFYVIVLWECYEPSSVFNLYWINAIAADLRKRSCSLIFGNLFSGESISVQ